MVGLGAVEGVIDGLSQDGVICNGGRRETYVELDSKCFLWDQIKEERLGDF